LTNAGIGVALLDKLKYLGKSWYGVTIRLGIISDGWVDKNCKSNRVFWNAGVPFRPPRVMVEPIDVVENILLQVESTLKTKFIVLIPARPPQLNSGSPKIKGERNRGSVNIADIVITHE
jgi:hypothetical protein